MSGCTYMHTKTLDLRQFTHKRHETTSLPPQCLTACSAVHRPCHSLCRHAQSYRTGGTRACNLSNSLMSCKQRREAKCYITWLLENGSPAKAYRWGHGDVISGYTHHHSRVTAQIFSYACDSFPFQKGQHMHTAYPYICVH